MKTISLLAMTAALVASTGAFAADLTIPAKPDAAIEMATANWDGFYVGLNAGYGWGNRTGSSTVFAAPFGGWDYDLSGGLIGAQAGFNYQLDNNLVVGVQVDADAANIAGNDSDQIPGGGPGNYNWLTTATAKLGYATDKYLVYVDGGYALANFNFSGSLGCNFSQTDGGFTAGVGASMKVSDNVSMDLSYHHVWFQDASSNCSAFGGFVPVTVSDAMSADVVKLGVNYRFGQ